jgi:biopolymer transport protein ExbB
MKRLFTILAISSALLLGGTFSSANAQPDADATEQAVQDSIANAEKEAKAKAAAAKAEEERKAQFEADQAEQEAIRKEEANKSGHQVIKEKFIEGGPGFMGIVLFCLIVGLALSIERIIYLNMATTNTKKLLNDIESALNSGGVEAAKEVSRNTKGPVASIFYQGLDRAHEGIDIVEKSVMAYGGVQMGLLEKGLSWISLFIALAPMLGFMGTVIGMIEAFDTIQEANNIEPALVAGGIKIALLTTVFGLITAIILQVFYNYIVAKVDSIVNQMEDASISLIDLLVKNKVASNG